MLFKKVKMNDDKVTPVAECPMCGEEEDITSFMDICPINNPDHKICMNCVKNLKQKYNKEFCAYCGERPITINIPITIHSQEHTSDITIENQGNRRESCFYILKTVFIGMISYTGLILNWHLFRMIDHYMEEGETLDKEIDWHIFNALYALFIDICLLFFIMNIVDGYYKSCKR